MNNSHTFSEMGRSLIKIASTAFQGMSKIFLSEEEFMEYYLLVKGVLLTGAAAGKY